MASPNYIAYAPAVIFVDDVGGSGGTSLVATNFNGLRNDLASYLEFHINGEANNHATADILDTTLPETTAWANVAGLFYGQSVRNDMIANTLALFAGGTGTLAARLATLAGLSGANLNTIGSANAVGSVANAGKLAKYDTLGGLTLANLAVTAGPVTIDGTGHILTAGALGISGMASLNGGATISGAIILSGGALTVDAGGNLVSAGTGHFAGALNAGNTVVGGTLAVTGATGLASLTVTTLATSSNATVAGTLGVTGIATFAAALNANGGITGTTGAFSGALAANGGISGTSGTFSGTVAAALFSGPFAPRTQPAAILSDLALSATGASNVVTMAAGIYPSSTGGLLNLAQTTLTPVIPTTGSQWAVLYNDDSGILTAAYGTVGGAATTAIAPNLSLPLGWVSMPANCVGIYSSQADWVTAGSPGNKGYIVRTLLLRAAGGSGGGGGGAAVSDALVVAAPGTSSATMLSQTGVTTAANIVDLVQGNGAGTINGQNLATLKAAPVWVAPATNSNATLNDLTRAFVSGGIASPGVLSQGVTTGTLTVNPAAAGGGEIVYAVGSAWNQHTAAITSNAVSGAGLYSLRARLAVGGPSLVLAAFGASPGALDVVLCTVYFDGTNFQLGLVDWSPLFPTLGSTLIQPTTLDSNSSLVSNVGQSVTTTTLTALTTALPSKSFYAPCQLRAWVWFKGYITLGASGSAAHYLAAMLDSAAVAGAQNFYLTDMPGSSAGSRSFMQYIPVLSPGLHTFAIGAATAVSGGTNSVNVNFCEMNVLIFR